MQQKTKLALWIDENASLYTREELAIAFNVSVQTINNFKNGMGNPHLETAILIEDFTKGEVTIRDLAVKKRSLKNRKYGKK